MHGMIKNIHGMIKNMHGMIKNMHGMIKNIHGMIKNMHGMINKQSCYKSSKLFRNVVKFLLYNRASVSLRNHVFDIQKVTSKWRGFTWHQNVLQSVVAVSR
jgi:hypothetical protein